MYKFLQGLQQTLNDVSKVLDLSEFVKYFLWLLTSCKIFYSFRIILNEVIKVLELSECLKYVFDFSLAVKTSKSFTTTLKVVIKVLELSECPKYFLCLLTREGLRIITSLFSGHTIILRGLSHFLKNVQGKSFCKKAWQWRDSNWGLLGDSPLSLPLDQHNVLQKVILKSEYELQEWKILKIGEHRKWSWNIWTTKFFSLPKSLTNITSSSIIRNPSLHVMKQNSIHESHISFEWKWI